MRSTTLLVTSEREKPKVQEERKTIVDNCDALLYPFARRLRSVSEVVGAKKFKSPSAVSICLLRKSSTDMNYYEP
jgi:hypothetical protein